MTTAKVIAGIFLALSVFGEFVHEINHHPDRPLRGLSPAVNAFLEFLTMVMGFAWITFLVVT